MRAMSHVPVFVALLMVAGSAIAADPPASEASGETEHDPLVASDPSAPKKKKKADYKIGGRLGMGRDFPENSVPENQFEMRLGIQTRRKKGFKANVEIRADEGSREVRIQDAFVDYRNHAKTSRVRFGRGKKILGWQYDYSTAQRLTLRRTLPYQYLSERMIVGRDYFVSYDFYRMNDVDPSENEKDRNADDANPTDGSYANPHAMIDPSQKWQAGVAIHYDEVRNQAIILNAIATLSPHFRLGAWLIGQSNRTSTGSLPTYGGMVSGLFEKSLHRAAVEVYVGGDPFRNVFERDYGTGRKITLGSIRAEYGAYLGQWNPYVAPTLLLKDLSRTQDRMVETIVGARYYFTDHFNVALELSQADFDSREITRAAFSRRTSSVLARYFF